MAFWIAWKGVGEALIKVKKRFVASGAVGYNIMTWTMVG
jgi:hypothetical protein